MPTGRWQFSIDRGGTFTDIVAVDPAGRQHFLKLLSENPQHYADAALAGIERLLAVQGGGPIASIKMGTTVATNALLERKGDRTVLVITAGLEDQLEIGTQARPDIFARQIVKPQMLYERVAGARERIRSDGTVEAALDEHHLAHMLKEIRAEGITCAAIAFLHGYAYPEHEQRAADIARAAGFTQVSVSHEVTPLIRIVPRADTTVADAYLTPVLRRYVDRIADAVGSGPRADAPRLSFMTSAGGLTPAHAFRGRDAILSGPAGGVVAMAQTAMRAGFDKVIGFDMGGTSTDVSHFAGEHERSLETEVAGVRLATPMLKIHTVAAGGGSILGFDGTRLTVGPHSAGSTPGPACYRRGGPLTMTDANVLTGKILPQHFPAVFGADGKQPIDAGVVRSAFEKLARDVPGQPAPEHLADSYIRIGCEIMANAIKKISVERGYDVSQYA